MARFAGLAPASEDPESGRQRLAYAVESLPPGQAARGQLSLRSSVETLLREVPAWLWPALLVLAGTLLRMVPWLANYPLHRDEALYGYWAQLVIRGSDPGMITAWVDKPPLVLYLLAGSLGLFGISERAIRVPGMVAGVMIIATTYGLARHASGRRTALLATALVAASPFAILFAPTAFTDPWLALWLVAAAWAALAGRSVWSGILLGLAAASKQTGVLGAPLVMTLIWANTYSATENHAAENGDSHPSLHCRSAAIWQAARQTALCLGGVALVMGPVVWWDSLRWCARPSFWTRSLETYGGLHLAHLTEWPERARRWSEQIGYLYGHPTTTAGILILAIVAIACAWRKRSAAPAERHSARVTLIIAAYCAGYLAVHFLVTFQPWDRYLLPLLPLLAILAAQGMRATWQKVRSWHGHGATVLTRVTPSFAVLLLVWSAWLGTNGEIPVGSGHEAYAGLDQVVERIRTLPWSSVVYQRSLGWQLDFYFFQAPPARIWWDDPQTLVDDALYGVTVVPERQQWLVLATAVDEQAGSAARQALAAHGLEMVERQRICRTDHSPSLILYEILPSGGPRD